MIKLTHDQAKRLNLLKRDPNFGTLGNIFSEQFEKATRACAAKTATYHDNGRLSAYMEFVDMFENLEKTLTQYENNDAQRDRTKDPR